MEGKITVTASIIVLMAGVALIAGLWAHRRAPRTDLARAGYVLAMFVLVFAVDSLSAFVRGRLLPAHG